MGPRCDSWNSTSPASMEVAPPGGQLVRVELTLELTVVGLLDQLAAVRGTSRAAEVRRAIHRHLTEEMTAAGRDAAYLADIWARNREVGA